LFVLKKTLQLNVVRESEYAKLLPSHLNERAKRVFAALSYEQCLDYSFVKSQIIASFRVSAALTWTNFGPSGDLVPKIKNVCGKTN